MNYCMFINITQRLLHAVRNILLIVIGHDSKLTVHMWSYKVLQTILYSVFTVILKICVQFLYKFVLFLQIYCILPFNHFFKWFFFYLIERLKSVYSCVMFFVWLLFMVCWDFIWTVIGIRPLWSLFWTWSI